jgi:hypothetical protein
LSGNCTLADDSSKMIFSILPSSIFLVQAFERYVIFETICVISVPFGI